MKRRLATMLALLLLITITSGCAAGPPASPEPVKPDDALSPPYEGVQDYIAPDEYSKAPGVLPEPENDIFDKVAAMYSEGNVVRLDIYTNAVKNAALLDEWVENYRQGIPGKVVIAYYRGFASPAWLNVLESDGSATYTITMFGGIFDEHVMPSAHVLESSRMVIKRGYDYVFGADWSPPDQRLGWNSYIIPRVTIYDLFDFEMLEWDPATGPPFDNITLAQAEQRAREVNENLMRYWSVTDGMSTRGGFLCESVLGAANYDVIYRRHGDMSALHYKIVGAARMGGNIYYIVYAHANLELLTGMSALHHTIIGERRLDRNIYRDVHGHSFLEFAGVGEIDADESIQKQNEISRIYRMLVGVDGRLVFTVGDTATIFVDDAQQEIIAP